MPELIALLSGEQAREKLYDRMLKNGNLYDNEKDVEIFQNRSVLIYNL